MEVGPVREDRGGLLGQVRRQSAVGMSAADRRERDQHIRPDVQVAGIDHRRLRPAVGGQRGEGGVGEGGHPIEVEVVRQDRQRGTGEDNRLGAGYVDHDGRCTVLERGAGGLATECGNGSALRVPGDQRIHAREGEEPAFTAFVDHGHHRHVTALVTAHLVPLVQHGKDAAEQPLATQPAGQADGVALPSGQSDQCGTHPGISAAVVVGEGGRGQGPALARILRCPGRHGGSVREHNRPVTATARPRWLILTALVMVAFNLRIALTSVPALEADIAEATGWSSAAIGALTTIPVVCMGAFALLVPRIARRIGRRHTIALALAMLTLALVARLFATTPGVLPMSVLVAGIGIALAAGLVPSVVREQLPSTVGYATGLWTAAMMIGAALGGALTVPLAAWLGSWPAALAVWAVPAGIGLVVWWIVEGGREDGNRGGASAVRIRDLPWRSRTAWALTLYLTFNSIIFYTSLAWLAPSYVDRGWSQAEAGFLFGAFTASQVIAALVMPALAERAPARRALYAAMLALVLVGLILIGVVPDTLTILVVTIFGAALGAGFAMGLALLSEFAADGAASARLTAMAFAVAYLCGAVGPLIAGRILDVSGSWELVYALLAAVGLAQFATVPALRRGSSIS